MLMTINFSCNFQQMLCQKKFNSYQIQFLKFLHGWLLTFYLSTLLKLNFFSLAFQHNFHNSHLQFLQVQRYNLFLLLEILVLSLILIFLLLLHVSACLDGAGVSASDWGPGGPRSVPVPPKTNFSIMFALSVKSTGGIKSHKNRLSIRNSDRQSNI